MLRALATTTWLTRDGARDARLCPGRRRRH
jgi:hypothetical protein